MLNQLYTTLQSLLPQHAFSALMGRLADARTPWLKNFMIHAFMKRYSIDLHDACIQQPESFSSFNDFFIRKLRPETRPIDMTAHSLVSPVDGTIAAIGTIEHHQLLQAKNHHYTLGALLGHDQPLTQSFYDGAFATLYLAPHNYHRVHMPLAGRLEKTIYVPGALFSVNRITTESITNLYTRNERLVTVFQTEAGKMAVVLVGAMIVGSIQPIWKSSPVRAKKRMEEVFSDNITLEKGQEMGHFKLGSTVILLFEKDRTHWAPGCQTGQTIQFGQLLGRIDRMTEK